MRQEIKDGESTVLLYANHTVQGQTVGVCITQCAFYDLPPHQGQGSNVDSGEVLAVALVLYWY